MDNKHIHYKLLKFGNGWVISWNTLMACDYLSSLGLKLIHASKRGLYK